AALLGYNNTDLTTFFNMPGLTMYADNFYQPCSVNFPRFVEGPITVNAAVYNANGNSYGIEFGAHMSANPANGHWLQVVKTNDSSYALNHCPQGVQNTSDHPAGTTNINGWYWFVDVGGQTTSVFYDAVTQAANP